MEALTSYEKEQRPWGNFERFTLNEKTTVKIITVNAGEELSLQKHNNRTEFWKIISGSGFVTIGQEKIKAIKGETFSVLPHVEHRITAEENFVILEIAFGDFDETDIVRLDDKYGRN
ncbi:MAG: phosphomannose isomerase type II C-terminal cupin domain [Candidatus Nomurabacteria bacterium]|nr:phosphomannose isomerase type II C-terminal cupin domain [Candidatus Nomurabacteria bacterium]